MRGQEVWITLGELSWVTRYSEVKPLGLPWRNWIGTWQTHRVSGPEQNAAFRTFLSPDQDMDRARSESLTPHCHQDGALERLLTARALQGFPVHVHDRSTHLRLLYHNKAHLYIASTPKANVLNFTFFCLMVTAKEMPIHLHIQELIFSNSLIYSC